MSLADGRPVEEPPRPRATWSPPYVASGYTVLVEVSEPLRPGDLLSLREDGRVQAVREGQMVLGRALSENDASGNVVVQVWPGYSQEPSSS